jgi:hypothetical protein
MKFITVAGPPSSGKTLSMIHLIRLQQQDGLKVVVGKIDCLETSDGATYKEKLGIPVVVGLSDYVCPDHYGVVNVEEIFTSARTITVSSTWRRYSGSERRMMRISPSSRLRDCATGVRPQSRVAWLSQSLTT